MKYLKGIGFGLAYSAVFCALPFLIYLRSGSDSSAGLLIFYLIIAFATMGFVAYSVISKNEPPKTNREIQEKLDNIEIQNAAIAFSLSEVKRAVKKNDLE